MPTPGAPKIFFRYFLVNPATGEKSLEKLATAVYSEEVLYHTVSVSPDNPDNGSVTPSAPTHHTRVQAIFETDLEASVNVEIEGEGQVTGDGDYHIGDTAVLRAVPDAGYRFAGWSDGETAAERSIVVEDSVWLTATFEEEE